MLNVSGMEHEEKNPDVQDDPVVELKKLREWNRAKKKLVQTDAALTPDQFPTLVAGHKNGETGSEHQSRGGVKRRGSQFETILEILP